MSSTSQQADPQQPADPPDPWSLQVARISAIPIRLHFTFLILLGWYAFRGYQTGTGNAGLIFVSAAFACVLLHELGHALSAARYGIRTASITLYPIGGIARITKRPTPGQEFWIALAGPAVNVVIAAILALVIASTHGPMGIDNDFRRAGLLSQLLSVNLVLALFNLIPAFPMDGGRVLRAALALSGMPFVRATRLAANVGQALAICAAVAGFVGQHWILMFIALFIYIGAGQETQATTQEAAFSGVPLSSVMVTKLETLEPGARLREVADRLIATSQQDFPVTNGDEVIGLLTRDHLLRGLAQQGPDAYVAGIMDRLFKHGAPNDILFNVIESGMGSGTTLSGTFPLVVLEEGRLMGLVTAENVAEFLAIRQSLAMRGRHVPV